MGWSNSSEGITEETVHTPARSSSFCSAASAVTFETSPVLYPIHSLNNPPDVSVPGLVTLGSHDWIDGSTPEAGRGARWMADGCGRWAAVSRRRKEEEETIGPETRQARAACGRDGCLRGPLFKPRSLGFGLAPCFGKGDLSISCSTRCPAAALHPSSRATGPHWGVGFILRMPRVCVCFVAPPPPGSPV